MTYWGLPFPQIIAPPSPERLLTSPSFSCKWKIGKKEREIFARAAERTGLPPVSFPPPSLNFSLHLQFLTTCTLFFFLKKISLPGEKNREEGAIDFDFYTPLLHSLSCSALELQLLGSGLLDGVLCVCVLGWGVSFHFSVLSSGGGFRGGASKGCRSNIS